MMGTTRRAGVALVTGLLAGLASLAVGPGASAQAHRFEATVVRTPLDSGRLGNDESKAKVVFAQVVGVPGGVTAAPWIRLVFDRVELDPGSSIRITSLDDGEYQVHTAETAAEWQNTTAYFNGGAVIVELIAGPITRSNRIELSRSVVGFGTALAERRVCDSFDNRTASTDARVGRLLSIGLPLPNCPGQLPCGTVAAALCTAEIIDVPLADNAMDRVLVSAGHCFDTLDNSEGPARPATVVQFGAIPDTDTATCGMRQPPVTKQFAVNHARLRHNNPGDSGNDWAAFACCKNPNTMKTVFEEQGQAFTLAAAAPANGSAVTKFGYGADGPASTRFCGCVPGQSESAKYGTQQTSTGTFTAAVGPDFVVRHNCHTCGGDSGCALVDDMGRLVAIHTAGGCQPNPTPPMNSGAAIINTNLQAAIAAVAAAVRPLNDDCANALPIANGTFAFSTKGATTDGPAEFRFPPLVFGTRTVEKDIWFRYTNGDTAATIMFSLCNSGFDTRLAIYDNACPTGPDTALAVDDDSTGCDSRSELTHMLAPYASVLVRVGGFNGAEGTGTLEVGPVAAPRNDICDSIRDHILFAGVGSNAFNIAHATLDGPAEAACLGGQINRDVWFRFFACATGRCRIETCGSPFDTCLAVYQTVPEPVPPDPAFCPRGMLIAASDDTCGVQSRVEINVVAGTTYLIRVGAPMQFRGAGTLYIHPIEPENDDCADAIIVGNGRTLFDNRGATTDGPEFTNCFVRCEKDLWYFYTFPGPGPAKITFETCDFATDFDTVLAIHAGTDCPPMGAESHCNDDGCGPASRIVVDNVNAGDDFYIRVGSFNAERTGCGALRITPSADLSPTNNDACTFFFLPEGSTQFTTVGATLDGTNPVGCLDPMIGQDIEADIWYQFITSTAGNVVVAACDADFDARLAAYNVVFAGMPRALVCPPAAAAVACGDDECGAGGTSPILNIPIPVDADGDPTVDFWIRVGGFDDGVNPFEGTGTLNVRVLPNDNCAAAALNAGRIGIGDGDNAFDSLGARTDGPALGAACDPMNMAFGDLWFVYRASNSGNTDFTVTAPFENFIAVYPAPTACNVAAGKYRLSCPTGAPTACDHANALAGGLRRSRVTVMTMAGTEYWVRVGGFGSGKWGQGTINVMPQPLGPENDLCYQPRVAELGDNPFSTIGAATDGPAIPAGCIPDNQIHQDVWFTYVPPMDGNLVVETCATTNPMFDTRIAVYTQPGRPACPPMAGPAPVLPATCTALTLRACNDDAADPACAPRSRLNLPVFGGVIYRIRVGGANMMPGEGILTLRFIMNDVCQRAKPILPGGGTYFYTAATIAFDNSGADTSGAVVGAPCNGFGDNQINQDLWYFFSAPRRGRLTLDTIGSTFDTRLAVYDGGMAAAPTCPPPVAFITCNDDIAPGNTRSRVSLDAVGGQNYLIRVGSFGPQQGPGVLNVKFTDNDGCDGFRSATNGAYNFDTRDATPGGMASCGDSNMAPDVWFRYRATCNGDLVADTCTASFDTVLSVYNDNCMAPAERRCNDDDFAQHCSGLLQSYLTVPVVTGDDYLIRIAGYQMQSGTGVLTLRCIPPGACCAGSTCLVLRGSECTGAARRFVGPGTACNAAGNLVAPCCFADYNQSGTVSVQDIFDFVAAYLAGDATADINGVGGVTVQDVFDFLAAWFAGCS